MGNASEKRPYGEGSSVPERRSKGSPWILLPAGHAGRTLTLPLSLPHAGLSRAHQQAPGTWQRKEGSQLFRGGAQAGI